MRIVYCINRLAVGGIEAITVAKANLLSEKGNQVWIITCCEASPSSPFPISEKVTLCGIDYPCSFIYKFPWNIFHISFTVKKKLRGLLREIEPDIVVSADGIDKWLVPVRKPSWSSIREIHSFHDSRWMVPGSMRHKLIVRVGEFLDYKRVKRYDRIVILTEEDYKKYWKRKANVCVIPDFCRFTRGKISQQVNKRIIAVGRLADEKDYPSLLRVARIVFNRYPDWCLDILGEGDERPVIESMIKRYSLQDNVFLQGAQTNVQDWMAESSILVLTSKYEGFAMVLVEAMTCGLPVVSYACPVGPKDIISDGVDGFLVPPGDEETFASRICELIADEPMRKRMGASALKKSERYEADTVINQWIDLFEQLRLNSQVIHQRSI